VSTLTKPVIQLLNQRLEAKGSNIRIVETNQPNVVYDTNTIVETIQTEQAPFLIDEIKYTNCGTAKQTIKASVNKKTIDTYTVSLKRGLSIGAELQLEIKVGIVTIKPKMSFNYSSEETTTVTSSIEHTHTIETPIEIGPMKRIILQAIITQEKVKDVPFTLHVFLKEGALFTMPKDITRLKRYYHPTTEDHFYTTGVEHPEDNGYIAESDADPGYIHTTHVSGSTPFYRYFNNTSKHFYTTDYQELGSGRDGYTLEGVIGYIYPNHAPNTVPLHRYFNATKGTHFYTTDYNELGEKRNGYIREGNAGYLFSRSAIESGATQEITELFPNIEDRRFEYKGTFRGESTVRNVEAILVESAITPNECAVLAKSLGVSYGDIPPVQGLYAERTDPQALPTRPILHNNSTQPNPPPAPSPETNTKPRKRIRGVVGNILRRMRK
jgi:hypothetical protein